MRLIPPLLLAAILTHSARSLTNPDFEATPFSSGWTLTGAPVSVAGIAPGSVNGVRFTATGQAMRQTVTWPADWYVECYFAIRSTTARAFSVIVDAGAANAINFRYEGSGFAAFNGSGWSALSSLGTVTPSVDANADGDLADAGDTRNVYRLRITGRGWGSAGATYDVQVTDANGAAFTRSATGLAFYQIANAAVNARPSAVKFGSEFGSNPGWWLDDVSSHDETPPADPPEIAWLVASPENAPAGTPVTLTWSASAAESLTLAPGGPALTGASTSATVTPAATTTYTLTATNSGGSVSRTVTVGVGGTPQPLRLNEFLASNVSGLTDEDGDRSDWIELHNPNAWSVNLGGLALTDDARIADKWIFPTQTIAPGGYLVVFASAKNRATAGLQLHTNFSLASAGEYLALMDRSGAVIQEFAPSYAAQADDVSTDGTAYFGAPTPGAANLPGPYLSAPVHTAQADGSYAISVRAVNASAVTLKYRVMYAAEQTVSLTADAGGTWTGTIPAGAAAPGQMLRWYFTATDTASRTARLPAYLTTTAPQYLGTVIPNPAVASQLRVFEWFMEPVNFAAADTLTGARGSVYHLGEFYDNVLVTLRGATTASFSKKPHKFQFHDSQPFRFRADLPRVDEINVNAAFSDGSYLRDYLAYRDLLAAGIPTPSVEPLRVQRNGAFHSMGVMIENVDRRFLRRHNLDETGPLYKATGNGSWLTGTTGFETRNGAVLADLAAYTAGIAPTNANRQTYLFDNTNLPAVVNYLAANVLGSIYNPQKNYYAFRNTKKGEWQIIAWDRDFSYGDIWLGAGDTRYPAGGPCPTLISNERIEHAASNEDLRGGLNRLFEAVMATPLAREMFYRRLRTLLDGHFAPGNIEAILNDWAPRMKPEADMDRAAWGYAPGPGGPYAFGSDSFDASITQIRTQYLPGRRTYLYSNNTTPTSGVPASATWMRGTMPAAQTASPAIVIHSVEASPASGNQDQEYIELRNPTTAAADISGWKITGGVQHTLHAGTVIPAGGSLFLTPSTVAFRARTVSPRAGESRFVQGNYDGHLSNFSETITLSDTAANVVATFVTPNTPTDVQRFLRISEFSYNPGAAAPDAEFVEVVNTAAASLNIGGAAFTNGFDFVFPANFTLPAGGRAVVVLNSAAFAAAFPGNTATIAGTFTAGRLSNGGETIKLDDATGSTVEEFTYNSQLPWPVPMNAVAASLERVHTATTPNDPLNWRAAAATPGASSTQSLAAWMAAKGYTDPTADPDGNGLNHLLDYALGADLVPFPAGLLGASQGAVTVTFQRRAGSEATSAIPEMSADLLAWSAAAGSISAREIHDGVERITLTLPAGQRRHFVRMLVTTP